MQNIIIYLVKFYNRGKLFDVKKYIFFVLLCYLISDIQAAEIKNNESIRGPKEFVLFELFTSEGCYSCPPAERFLEKIIKEQLDIENKHVFAVAFHVDYWNYLGWNDPYSSAEYSQRQRNYAFKIRPHRVYTPQIVVNGSVGFVGSDRKLGRKLIQKALQFSSSSVLVLTKLPSQEGEVKILYATQNLEGENIANIVLLESNIVRNITSGENSGKTLVHYNIARSFSQENLGNKTHIENTATITIPNGNVTDNSSILVYIQDKKTYLVKNVAQIDL